MIAICRAYATESEAHAAAGRALAAGTPDVTVRVLTGEAARDAREETSGGFAGPGADAVGAYAGAAHSGREAMSAFAGEGGDPRRGGFADADRETVTTLAGDVEHVRGASHHALERMLLDAGLDEATAKSDVEALHHGRVLVLVSGATPGGAVAAALDA
jgi:hypothetical protein